VSFGANLWALDNDLHTALDVAALANRTEVVRHLDTVYAKQLAGNRKLVKKLREKAVAEATARAKRYNKLQEKARKKAEKEDRKLQKQSDGVYGDGGSYGGTLTKGDGGKFSTLPLQRSSSTELKPYSHHFATINTQNRKGTSGGVARMIKKKKEPGLDTSQDFKIGERDMDGTKTIKSLSGLRRDNHIMYVRPTSATNGKGSLSSSDSSSGSDVMSNSFPLARTISEPDFYFPGDSGIESSSSPDPDPSIFERPGFGNVAFINKNITSSALLSLSQIRDEEDDEDVMKSHTKSHTSPKRHSVHDIAVTDTASIGTVGTLARRIRDFSWDNQRNAHTSGDLNDDDDDVTLLDPDGNNDVSLDVFLAANNLADFQPVFRREKIDLAALMLLSDADLRELGLPMGPRRKVLKAVERRKYALEKPGLVMDSFL
jgi:hypothetical protein